MSERRAALAQLTVVDRLKGLFTTPEEGWGTLIAGLVAIAIAAYAIDESGWVGVIADTRTRQTAFLPIGVVLAGLIGFATARSRLTTFRAHLVGATIGGLYLVFAASGAISNAPDISTRLHALATSVGVFIGDVLVVGRRSSETSIFLLLSGALLWSAAQLGLFSLFRRHRPAPLIGMAATGLLINMSITVNDQLPHLVIFVAAALLLIVRTSLYSQLQQWRVRRIADSGYASQLFLRSGASFVAVAILSSLVLAANASSAPLRPLWDDALGKMIEVGIEINHVIGGVSGPARGPNLLFTPTQTIREQWETSNELVFKGITADGNPYKWRGASYDFFDGRSWQHVVGENVSVPAFQSLDGISRDGGFTVGRHDVLSEITPVSMSGSVIVAPAEPFQLDHEVVAQVSGDGGLLNIRLAQGVQKDHAYLVTSRVFDIGGPNQLTEYDLSTAGVDYSATPWVYRHTLIRDGSIGPKTKTVADNIVQSLRQDERDPFHISKAVYQYLYSKGGFQYQTDVRGLCTGQNVLDCFLTIKKGYCEYFATAMVMMLRTQQIPARYVVGYLPGKRQEDGSFNIERSASHAWVEVYFPGIGWYPFDPTPGLTDQGQEITTIPSGAPRGTPRPNIPEETPYFGPTFDEGGTITPPDVVIPPGQGTPSTFIGLIIGVLVLGAAIVLIVVASTRRRLPPGAQVTYDSVARMASRFGYGPTPSQTAYEYADRLSMVVPQVRNELQIVATAKVEAIYAKREPSEELRAMLARAYRRVRLSLLRLVLRRPRWLSLPRATRPPREDQA